MSNHTKTNLNARDWAHDRKQVHKRGLLLSFIIFMAWVAGIGLLLSLIACQPVSAKPIATNDNSGYHSPTTKHSAAKPSRQSLAIFVPNAYLSNKQQATTGMNTSVTSSSYTYDIGHNVVRYDGMSEPNKIPFLGNKFRGLNAVVVIPFYPFSTLNNTKHSGGHYHA